jgi:hypothetical protein
MANASGAATALVARLSLLVLNLALFGLGVALVVMGSNKSGTAGLIRAIYSDGGVTMGAFQQPDIALTFAGAFITITSIQVRDARPTPSLRLCASRREI